MSMHDFIEDAKRGGIAIAGHRYFKANNPKMGKAFNPSKPTTWISYIDANNLYSWAMSQYLPIGNYKWEINAHFTLKTHDYLSDLPPAVENMAVNKNMLCPYTTELVDKLNGGRFSATKKLAPHLGPRKEYIIHYQELQYYIKLGIIIDEVIEILSFDQTNCLAPYIAFNTKKCQGAKNAFEKDFFKLMNSSVYSKTMENVRAHMGKASMTLNKPIIVRASVLGLSKLLMYRFWYGYVKERYGLFKDETPISVIAESIHIRGKSYHYVLANKSTTSKHKGVSKKGISEIATNSYIFDLEGTLLDDPVDRSLLSEEEVKNLAIQTEADPITLVYQDCLFDNKVFYAKNVGIRSKDHILSLVELEKKGLCPIDTKRWILSDKITSLPYYYWRIQAYKNFISNRISPELAEE
ncbi:protein nynrin [Gigaspora margarita]|uniref:Protein nynrin n=1 Tax=Gigaspora margarita TaxID=4874 RepID=A0A8H4B6E2_GIGMA|nr:protein nynrin [Gigaspora margarita]